MSIAKWPDEIALWESFGENGVTPRDAGDALNMHPKRINYLCEKWSNLGIYDYGVSADLGWKTPAAQVFAPLIGSTMKAAKIVTRRPDEVT